MDSSSKLTSPVAPSRSSSQNASVPKVDYRPTQPDVTVASQSDRRTMSIDQCVPSDASYSAQACVSSQPCATDQSHPTRLRCSSSVENFSRPVTRTSYLPISPPKRVSSRNALVSLTVPVDRPSPTIDAAIGMRTPPRKTARSSKSLVQLPLNLPCQEPATIIPVIGHAISTIDDSARHLKSSPLPRIPPSLEDVVEERDAYLNEESADSSSRHHSQNLLLRHVQSLPATRVEGLGRTNILFMTANPHGRLLIPTRLSARRPELLSASSLSELSTGKTLLTNATSMRLKRILILIGIISWPTLFLRKCHARILLAVYRSWTAVPQAASSL